MRLWDDARMKHRSRKGGDRKGGRGPQRSAGKHRNAPTKGRHGGPQLARILARDGFLPRQIGQRSDRLAYGGGILAIASGAVLFLVATGALVTLLIPAYAIGVFLGFTISQTGMVVHWRRLRGDGWYAKALLNGVGAVVTGVVFVIISIAKFAVGGWIIFVLVPLVALLMAGVRRRYNRHERELAKIGRAHV